MPFDLKLLHSCETQAALFDTARRRVAPDARLTHDVRADWRKMIERDGITEALRKDVAQMIADSPAPVLCSCPILMGLVKSLGGYGTDQALIKHAARLTLPGLVVAACPADATALRDTLLAASVDQPERIIVALPLPEFDPLLVADDHAGYHAAVAAAILDVTQLRPELGLIILGDCAMAPVCHLLEGLGLTCLTPQETALSLAFAD